jgi:hypothetical protein
MADLQAEKKINYEIDTMVNNMISVTRKDFTDTYKEGGDYLKDLDKDMNSYFNISYNVEYNSGNLLSLGFNSEFYSIGAAHPGTDIFSLNYDLSTGKRLKLSGLFQPGSKYLKQISDYSIKKLDSILSDWEGADARRWIREGAGPKEENYESWTFTKTGLHITFNQYQVGPYAIGPQEVTMPYDKLTQVFREDLRDRLR